MWLWRSARGADSFPVHFWTQRQACRRVSRSQCRNARSTSTGSVAGAVKPDAVAASRNIFSVGSNSDGELSTLQRTTAFKFWACCKMLLDMNMEFYTSPVRSRNDCPVVMPTLMPTKGVKHQWVSRAWRHHIGHSYRCSIALFCEQKRLEVPFQLRKTNNPSIGNQSVSQCLRMPLIRNRLEPFSSRPECESHPSGACFWFNCHL